MLLVVPGVLALGLEEQELGFEGLELGHRELRRVLAEIAVLVAVFQVALVDRGVLPAGGGGAAHGGGT